MHPRSTFAWSLFNAKYDTFASNHRNAHDSISLLRATGVCARTTYCWQRKPKILINGSRLIGVHLVHASALPTLCRTQLPLISHCVYLVTSTANDDMSTGKKNGWSYSALMCCVRLHCCCASVEGRATKLFWIGNCGQGSTSHHQSNNCFTARWVVILSRVQWD